MALLFLAPAGAFPMPGSGTVPPFGAGDWVVDGNETFSNRSIILAGNLVVRPGGCLTISNASVTMYSSYPEEHGLRVMAGGTLRVQNGSMVSAFDPKNTHRFALDAGSTVIFSNSSFIACGIRYSEVNQQITGGIISNTDGLTVDGCTFAGAHVAMTLYTGAAFTSTSFVTNYIGIISLGCWMDFTGCFFGNTILSATWAYYSSASFRNCTFVNNSIGISSDNSTCNITGCTFTRNSGDAVWASALMNAAVGPSELRLEDCLFESNPIGIGHYPDVANSTLCIINCDFLNNSKALDWENAGYSGNPYPGVTSWTVSRPCRALNSRFLFNGNISVESGGVLDLTGSNLTFDSDFNGESGLKVLSGGRVDIREGSLLRAHWGSFPYYLECGPGSTFSMEDSVLRDCGWNLSSARTSGPLFDGALVRIDSSTIDYNPAALAFRNVTGAVVQNSSLRGLNMAVDLDRSTATFQNSSLGFVAGPAAVLGNASVLECENSSIDRRALRFDDERSRVNLSWYLDLRAGWADGSPAGGARVGVRDVYGNEAASEVLGADGLLKGLLLREATLGRLGARNYTPHEVNCSVGTIFNRTLQTMDRSRTLDIVLVDREAPSVEIAYPDPDAYLKSGTVLVSGTASDNLGVEKVELLTDGYRRFSVYLATQNLSRSVAWNFTLSFFEGPHTVEARVFDPAGNSNSTVVAVTVDFTMPRIRIASPPEGYLTNLSLISVSGYMEPGCRVLLGGSEVKTDRDLFGGTIVLGEGKNTITATATDRAQNSNSSSIAVWLDTRPPALDVFWPPEGLRTGIPVVAVNGTMEPGAQVFVNGRSVALTGEPGTFSTAVSLAREKNSIVVDAVDLAGNHNVTARTVVLDTRPPALELTAPPEGYVTNLSSVVLSGFSEGGALLSVDGDTTLVPGEPGVRSGFSIPLSLAEGQNTIFISSADAAGNLNYSVRHVFLDTEAPGLVVNSPASGHRTSDSSVFITGETEPGAVVTINSREVPVGQTGSFSLESRLASGFNRFTVRATDSAGNSNETVVDVQRLAASGEDIFPAIVGPDWPFSGFLLLSALICISEGYLASRYVRKRRGV